MNQYLRLLRALIALENKIQSEMNEVISRFRLALMEASATMDRLQLSSLATQLIRGVHLEVTAIADNYAASVIEAVTPFIESQDVPVQQIFQRVTIFIGNVVSWVTAMSSMVSQAIANDNVDLNRALFSKQITQDGASAIRKSRNSMQTATQLGIFTFANSITLDSYETYQAQSNTKMFKVAIAKLDDNTTKTCKRAHKQVVPVSSDFILTERPRFAKRMKMPPFHFNCRTSVLLIKSQAEKSAILSQLE